MRVTAAIHGDLQKQMRMELEAAGAGVLQAVEETGLQARDRLREQVTSSGLGSNLAKAWKQRVYPNQVLNAATLVYSKAPKLHGAFDEGAQIYATPGHRWLAIPTPECLALFGYRVGGGLGARGGNRRFRISPDNWPGKVVTDGTTDQKRHSRRRAAGYGQLRPVWRPRPPHLLVVDNVRVGSGGRLTRPRQLKSGGLQSGTVTVVMFWLVPRVQLKKRLDVAAVAQWAEHELPEAIVRHYTRAAGDNADTEG